MSSTARWIIALFSLFCAVSFAYLQITSPFTPPTFTGWVMGLLIPLFCLAITIVCFPGPLQIIAARFLGGCVFAMSIFYIGSEIGKPLPSLMKYKRSDDNLINAFFFFIVFGLPGAAVLFLGWLPPQLLPKGIQKQFLTDDLDDDLAALKRARSRLPRSLEEALQTEALQKEALQKEAAAQKQRKFLN